MALKRQRTIIIDGAKYLITAIRRTSLGNYVGHNYSIKGPSLDFSSFSNLLFPTDQVVDILAEKMEKRTFLHGLRESKKNQYNQMGGKK